MGARCHGSNRDGAGLPEPTTPVHEKLAALAYATAILGDSWADHLSVLNWDRHELLVAEPAVQKLNESMIQELWDFVDMVDGDYLICRNSETLSSKTFRIVRSRCTIHS
jgi:hypothetical protein